MKIRICLERNNNNKPLFLTKNSVARWDLFWRFNRIFVKNRNVLQNAIATVLKFANFNPVKTLSHILFKYLLNSGYHN